MSVGGHGFERSARSTQRVQRLERGSACWPADRAGRRSRRAMPGPTSRPSAGTRRPRSRACPASSSPIAVPRRRAVRPAPTAAPAHSWCAARRDARSTPAAVRPAHRRTPRCLPRPRTPADLVRRPGPRRDGRGSSSATARRIPASPQVGAAAASPAGRRRPGRRARTAPRSTTISASQRIGPAQRTTRPFAPGLGTPICGWPGQCGKSTPVQRVNC